MLPRLLLLLAITCLPLMAQRKESSPVSANKGAGEAPPVFNKEVHVLRGQSVVIELTGTTSTGRDIVFHLRDERPKLGKFKEAAPVAKDARSATITYISDPKSKGNKDTFKYAGQVSGGSMGDERTVTIHISDTAAKLDFVDTVDAKRLLLGKPGERPFLLHNAGDAAWAAKIPAPKGWKWVHPADGVFRLEPGKEINARIACLAERVGEVDEVVDFAPGKRMRFIAKVVPPFTIVSGDTVLMWQKEPRGRAGNVEVANLDTDQPLKIHMTGPEWLTVDESLDIAPNKKAPVKLMVTTQHGTQLKGKLKVSVGTYSEEVEVTASPSPAVFSIVTGLDEKLGFHFGKLSPVALKTEKRDVTVVNQGGSRATLKVQAPEHFRLEPVPPTEGVALEPGREFKFALLPPNNVAGTFSSEMKLLGGDDIVVVKCSAGVDPATIPPTPGELAGLILETKREARPKPRDIDDQIISIRHSSGGGFLEEGNEDPTIPRVDVVDIVEDTGEVVTFGWDVPPGGDWKFRLMRATIKRLKSKTDPTKVADYVKVWEPCGDEVKYTVSGNRATATVKDLHPHMPFNFCIQTLRADGKVSWPGKPISYRPYPPDPSHWKRNGVWYGMAGGALVVLVLWLVKKWKQPISATA